MAQDFPSLNTNDQRIFDNYCKNHFISYNNNPAEDDSFLDFWLNFISTLTKNGAEQAINTMLVPKMPLSFNNADGISAEIYDSVAGKIPVIKIKDTADFENLVTNLIHKGKSPQILAQPEHHSYSEQLHASSFFPKNPTAMCRQK